MKTNKVTTVRCRKEELNIEKLVLPEANVLKIKNKSATAQILDAELDTLKCSFNNDMCVEINTKDYKYIQLTLENLKTLKRLILEVDAFYIGAEDEETI